MDGGRRERGHTIRGENAKEHARDARGRQEAAGLLGRPERFPGVGAREKGRIGLSPKGDAEDGALEPSQA